MKYYEYEVIYLNGNKNHFYCNGFIEAIVLAMAYAQKQGWDMRISYITDEKGTVIKNIEFPKYTF
jgi:hypothetical protein